MKKKYKMSLPFSKFHQKLANSDVTKEALASELDCLLISADIIVDAVSCIGCIVLWSKDKFSPNPAPDLAGFEFLSPLGPAPARFEVVQSGRTLPWTLLVGLYEDHPLKSCMNNSQKFTIKAT